MRAVFRFGKLERVRFISHLDLQTFLHRAFNRTDIPIAWSQGFNPHPVMSLAGALAMGWTSEYEVLDIKLAKPCSEEFVLSEMRKALPDGLPVYDVRFVDDSHASYTSLIASSVYDIKLIDGDVHTFQKACEAFLASNTVMAVRKTKSKSVEMNIRPLCKAISFTEKGITATLSLREQDTLKPDLLIETVARDAGIEKPQYVIHRVKLLSEDMTPILEI